MTEYSADNSPFNQLSPHSDQGAPLNQDVVKELVDRVRMLEEAAAKQEGVSLDQLPMADVMRFLTNNWQPDDTTLLLSGATAPITTLLGARLPLALGTVSATNVDSTIQWKDQNGQGVTGFSIQGGIDSANNRTYGIVDGQARSDTERQLTVIEGLAHNQSDGSSVWCEVGASADSANLNKVTIHAKKGASQADKILLDATGYSDWAFSGASGIPVGCLVPVAASFTPSGFLFCDGSAVSRTTYAALFAAIGTTWGAGNGSTTFNLPDGRGMSPLGASQNGHIPGTNWPIGAYTGEEAHTLSTAEMPVHAHGYTDPGHSHGSNPSGWSFLLTNGTTTLATTASGDYTTNTFGSIANAFTGITINNAGGGGSHNNMQPSFTVNWAIKY